MMENRKDRNAISGFQLIIESYGFAINDDQFHLGMRYAERFDGIFDAGIATKAIAHRQLPLRQR